MYTMVSQGFALERIENENITTIHGISSYEPKVFYRSTDRVAPHNVYTTGKMLAAGLEVTGLTRDYPEGYTPRLQFNHVDTELKRWNKMHKKLNIPFDSKPYFTYNTEDGLYYRYQFGEAISTGRIMNSWPLRTLLFSMYSEVHQKKIIRI